MDGEPWLLNAACTAVIERPLDSARICGFADVDANLPQLRVASREPAFADSSLSSSPKAAMPCH